MDEVPSRFELENKGFADLRLTSWLWRRINGAVDEARTRDLHLGKVALYQLSYYRRESGAGEETRTHTPLATDPKSAASAIPPHPQDQNGDPLGI